MSLVPSFPMESHDEFSFQPIAIAAAFLIASMMMREDDEEPSVAVPAEAPKAHAPSSDPVVIPLDALIFEVMAKSHNPLSARDIARQIPGADKSQVNSRLYSLLGKNKVHKCVTKGAPLWFL